MSAPSDASFEHAYFIKLGPGGKWEQGSLDEGKLRFGWQDVPLSEMADGEWAAIETSLRSRIADKGAATRDLKALRTIVDSTSADIWVTFSQSCLWWGRVTDGPIERDAVSTFRRLAGGWNDRDAAGARLLINAIPGGVSKTQRFSGTVCEMGEPEVLRRVLSCAPSPEFTGVNESYRALISATATALRQTHWKDFETCVDLIFRQAGWRRLGVLGETMKYSDLELMEPINGERYQCQVKAEAGLKDYHSYVQQFKGKEFRKLFFAVHSPKPDLASYESESADVEVLLPERLAEMVVDAGLVSWLLGRIR